jgi:hypothetical protein
VWCLLGRDLVAEDDGFPTMFTSEPESTSAVCGRGPRRPGRRLPRWPCLFAMITLSRGYGPDIKWSTHTRHVGVAVGDILSVTWTLACWSVGKYTWSGKIGAILPRISRLIQTKEYQLVVAKGPFRQLPLQQRGGRHEREHVRPRGSISCLGQNSEQAMMLKTRRRDTPTQGG